MKNYFGLFNSCDIYDESVFDDIKESLAECNEIPGTEVPDEWVYNDFYEQLNCERLNLDVETGGYIIALADLGLWDGRRIGYRKFGTNIKDIFDFCSCDDAEWYADKYNVRANLHHHDRTNRLVFRYVESEDELEKVCDAIYNGKIKDESGFFRMTKSIRPFIANVYGWKQYGKQASLYAA